MIKKKKLYLLNMYWNSSLAYKKKIYFYNNNNIYIIKMLKKKILIYQNYTLLNNTSKMLNEYSYFYFLENNQFNRDIKDRWLNSKLFKPFLKKFNNNKKKILFNYKYVCKLNTLNNKYFYKIISNYKINKPKTTNIIPDLLNYNLTNLIFLNNNSIKYTNTLVYFILKFFFKSKQIYIKIDFFCKKKIYFYTSYLYINNILNTDEFDLDILKDLNIFYNMTIGWKILDKKLMINNFNYYFNINHFKIHRVIGSSLKKFLTYIHPIINSKHAGICANIRGKFGLGGSVRKRKFFFIIGFNTSFSSSKNSSLAIKEQIWTHTGVMGTTIYFSNFTI